MKRDIIVIILASCLGFSTCTKHDYPITPDKSDPFDPTKDSCFLQSFITPTHNFPGRYFECVGPALSPDHNYLAGKILSRHPDSNFKEYVTYDCVYNTRTNFPEAINLKLRGYKHSWNRSGTILATSIGNLWKVGQVEFSNTKGLPLRNLISWSPTSDYLYFFGLSPEGQNGFYRVLNGDGTVEILFDFPPNRNPFFDFEMMDDDRFVFATDTALFIYDLKSRTYKALSSPIHRNYNDTVTYTKLREFLRSGNLCLSYNKKLNRLANLYGGSSGFAGYSLYNTGVAIYDFNTQTWKRIWEIPNAAIMKNGMLYGMEEGIQLLDNGNVLINVYSTCDQTYTTWEINGTNGTYVRKVAHAGMNFTGTK